MRRNQKVIELLEESPVIAALKSVDYLEECLKSECKTVFLLGINLCDMEAVTERLKENGKTVMVHIDLAPGLSAKEVAIDYISARFQVDGIISTRPALVKYASEKGMYGVLRTFIIDSMALITTKKQIDTYCPDMIEVMPGVLPRVLEEIHAYTKTPLIAGGLLVDKKDVVSALNAGADAISTTKKELWYI